MNPFDKTPELPGTLDPSSMPVGSDGLEPAEVDAIHREIEWDVAAGQGAKHFEQLLDETLLTNPSQAHDAESEILTTAAEEEERQAFESCRRELHSACTQALLPQGLRVEEVRRAEQGGAFCFIAKDRQGRRFETTITIETMSKLQSVARVDNFRSVVDLCVLEILQARDAYHRRVAENAVQ